MHIPARRILLCALCLAIFASAVLAARPVAAQTNLPGPVPAFQQAMQQGFGDRQNSYTWSMVWWKGKLYVGTGRSTQCVQQATGTLFYPGIVSYPPVDADIDCTREPQDLRLRAEIWRWTPETDTWDLVFRSPQDVPLKDFPGKTVARDIGFRSMVIFTEADGTEALYVGGASSNSFHPEVPGARLLRSTDGVNFRPVPQAAGTVLGDLNATSFRSMIVYNRKLYVIASTGYAGFGPVYESADPASGNNSFRSILPDATFAFELATFNGFLYVGTGANAAAWPPELDTPGFSVLKTDATGETPFTYTEVIKNGGDRLIRPSRSVVSMHVFKNQLYVGSDRPAELFRISPDDSWELIVGASRWTPEGIRYALSGFGDGFDNRNNIHVWRMQTYGDALYVGTMDQSTKWRNIPGFGERLLPEMGFDMYVTEDGRTFQMVTRTGFGDIFDVGVRNFALTSRGLIFGTANQYYGTKLWREGAGSNRTVWPVYLPFVMAGGPQAGTSDSGAPVAHAASAPDTVVQPPAKLRVDTGQDGAVVLSWEPVTGAARYQIWRSEYSLLDPEAYPEMEPDTWVGGPFIEVGGTAAPHFVDATAAPDGLYHYYVTAQAGDQISDGSNLVRAPSLALAATLDDAPAVAAATGGDLLAQAEQQLAAQRAEFAAEAAALPEWERAARAAHLDELARRVMLARVGLIPVASLWSADAAHD